MNKKLKEQLKTAFNAPEPKGKTEFLLSVNFPRMTWFDFILSQAKYIRKRIWIISCVTAMVALLGLHFTAEANTLSLVWIVSSILPFISLMTVTEIARSTSYNMAELEMSCKYNFANILLTRLGILSCFNMAIFLLIIISFHAKINFNIFRLGIYLLVPFMLTCLLSLFALNRLRSREALYACGTISFFVSIANAIFSTRYSIIFSKEYLSMCSTVFLILFICTSMEILNFIKRTEEAQWNLQLTD